MNNKVCYLVCSTVDDLPLAVVDSYQEICSYLDISHPTAWKMIKQRAIVKGCYVEKVLL